MLETKLVNVRLHLFRTCRKTTRPVSVSSQEGPYTLTMELGPKKTIPILVLGT